MVLDLVLDRAPHATAGVRLVSSVERGKVGGVLCATAVTTVDYVLSRALDRSGAREAVGTLLRIFDVAPVTGAVLNSALELGFDDFEDAVVHEATRLAGADAIVTRNVRDFEGGELPVYSPGELVAALDLR